MKNIETGVEIHPTAIVHPLAKVGRDVRIGAYSIVGEHVTLGDFCVLDSHVLIDGHTMVGANNRFFHGACIGMIPQDLKYKGDVTFVEIGEGNVFREFVTVNSATDAGEKTVIGSRCLLMAYVHIAHNCTIGNDVILANAVNLAGHVEIHDYATVGGVTCIHQFVKVGRYAFIGGGSRIERDVPPFIKVAGNPPKVYGINNIGLERRGVPRERISLVKKMYRTLYRSNLNVSQVLEQLRNGEFEDPERSILVDFLESSERGITK